jgi:hypothetical protein
VKNYGTDVNPETVVDSFACHLNMIVQDLYEFKTKGVFIKTYLLNGTAVQFSKFLPLCPFSCKKKCYLGDIFKAIFYVAHMEK